MNNKTLIKTGTQCSDDTFTYKKLKEPIARLKENIRKLVCFKDILVVILKKVATDIKVSTGGKKKYIGALIKLTDDFNRYS